MGRLRDARLGVAPRVDGGTRLVEHYPSGHLLLEGTQVIGEHGYWARHGPWTAYYENGQVWERGAYAEDLQDGQWDWWYENGQRMSSGAFRAGKRVGAWSWWYPDGQRMMTGMHDEDGVAEGCWSYWHANGRLAAEGRIQRGELSGHWDVWNEDGTPNSEMSGEYHDGSQGTVGYCTWGGVE